MLWAPSTKSNGGRSSSSNASGTPAQGGVDVDVVAGHAGRRQNVLNGREVVDRLGRGGADVDHDDRRAAATGRHGAREVGVVHLAAGVGADLHRRHPVVLDDLLDAVVPGGGVEDHAVGVHVAGPAQAELVALGAAAGHIAPPVVGGGAEQIGEPGHDLPLEAPWCGG